MIKSESFATDWSLRFPRIQRLRDDKSASEIQTHEEFKAMDQQNRGTTTGGLHAPAGHYEDGQTAWPSVPFRQS